jgi:creatinine amidohydrolase
MEMPMLTRTITAFACLLLSFAWLPRAEAAAVYMENMTWPEIRERIEEGATVAIVPTGGSEQNGPHMVIGKHNAIVRAAAGDIARKLTTALVTPVVPFTPAGRIEPAEGHMQFPGTISLSEQTFAMVLEDVARSLKQHGFKLICFIGDHGGSQQAQLMVADRLNREWQSSGVRVLHVSDYYSDNGQERWAQSVGIKAPNVIAHAGLADTSELMSVDAGGVRAGKRGNYSERDYRATGAMGDSSQASVNYGRRFVSLKVEAAVSQIQNVIVNAQ